MKDQIRKFFISLDKEMAEIREKLGDMKVWSKNLVEITERERKTNYKEILGEILTKNFQGLEKYVRLLI